MQKGEYPKDRIEQKKPGKVLSIRYSFGLDGGSSDWEDTGIRLELFFLDMSDCYLDVFNSEKSLTYSIMISAPR